MTFATLLAESESYWGILSSPAHLGAELTIEVATGIVGFLVGRKPWRRWHDKHDREVHGIEHMIVYGESPTTRQTR